MQVSPRRHTPHKDAAFLNFYSLLLALLMVIIAAQD